MNTVCYFIKVLADLLEIVVGAIYVDTEYNLQQTQTILKPLLSILFTITPKDVKLSPIRECQERFQKKRMNVYQECKQFGNGMTIATGVLVYKAKPFEIICTVRSDPKTAKSAALNNMAQMLLPYIQASFPASVSCAFIVDMFWMHTYDLTCSNLVS